MTNNTAIIGATNQLTIVKQVDFGLYLDGGELGEILLPKKFAPKQFNIGEQLTVFVYLHSDDKVIATTQTPLAKVGEFANLEVVAVNRIGAFLNWGLDKDLLVPFSEQKRKLEVGQRHIVYVYIDRVDRRITASAKIDKFLDQTPARYQQGQQVNLIIAGRSDLGFKAIINNQHYGVLYPDEVFEYLSIGSHKLGYIKQVRSDGKLDLTLARPAAEQRDELSSRILHQLEKNGGYLAISDKSAPELIYKKFRVSKRIYKQTLGGLMKQGLITIEPQGIRLK